MASDGLQGGSNGYCVPGGDAEESVNSWFKDQHGLTGHALGGWTVTGIYTVRSGSPFTYFDSTNNDGTYYNIARYVPSTPIHKWKYTLDFPNQRPRAQLVHWPRGLERGSCPEGQLLSCDARGNPTGRA